MSQHQVKSPPSSQRTPAVRRLAPQRAAAGPASANLQRSLGNRGLASWVAQRQAANSGPEGLQAFTHPSVVPREVAGKTQAAGHVVQAKLTVGAPDDPYEREADAVAAEVMRMMSPAQVTAQVPVQRLAPRRVQRICPKCRNAMERHGNGASGSSPAALEHDLCPECQKQLRRKENSAGKEPPEVSGPVEDYLRRTRGGGQPLAEPIRSNMESSFGHDFSGVRVHTGGDAARAAGELNAQAFTTGSDVYFGDGRYQPATRAGKQLLAHELTHVLQQNPDDRVPRLARSRVAGAIDPEITGRVDSHAPARARGIQRFELPSLGELAESAEQAFDDATQTGVDLFQSATDTITEAGDWLLTTAGQAALEAANALVGLWGGSVIIRKGCLVVSIPNIPLFPTFQKTLAESPPIGFFIPFAEGGTLIGPLPVAGMIGMLAYGQLSAETAVGPGVIRNIEIELCPFSDRYSGTAQLYAAAAIAPRLSLSAGLFAAGGVLIPMTPPIPIIAILEGGLRGIGTAWVVGAVQNTVTLGYSGGTLSFRNVTDFMGGALLTGDLQLFAALRLFEQIVCQYVHPLGHWETGSAVKLTIPIEAALGSGGATGGVGPISWGPIPISDIETAIRPVPTGWSCLDWAQIKQILCDNGVLPPAMCADNGDAQASASKTVTASGRCKCVGDDACGGGRIYEVCYTTQKDCKNAQKDLDDFCNNNSRMKERCTRPKCYYRHSQPTCPDNCDPGSISPAQEPSPDSQVCSPTGLTRADAIPFIWFKPRANDYYPASIRLSGQSYDRDAGRARLPTGEPIGVVEEYWPSIGKVLQLIPEGRGPGAGRFRAVLKKYGYDWSGLQADHVQDIEFSGPDDSEFVNLWPMDRSANTSAGARTNGQLIRMCIGSKNPTPVQGTFRQLKRSVPSIFGRYFVIRTIIR